MHSKNSLPAQNKTFIEQARQSQIIEATIYVLANRGYINASFAQIGSHAGISPSLISYHFDDRETLMRETLRVLFEERASHIDKAIAEHAAQPTLNQLFAAVDADLRYMAQNHDRFRALTELFFGFRTPTGVMSYAADKQSPMATRIAQLLSEGKQIGEFKNSNIAAITVLIEGAENSFLAMLGTQEDLTVDSFSDTLRRALTALLNEGEKTW